MEIKTTPLPKRLDRLQYRLAIAFTFVGIIAGVLAGFTVYLALKGQLIWAIVLVVLGLIPIISVTGWYLGRRIASPVSALAQGSARISAGDWDHRIQVKTSGELAVLVQAVNKMAEGLASTIRGLEIQIAKRTMEIEEHSSYLEAAVEVSSAVASVLDAERLSIQIVELIRQRFSLYYVGLFLVDETNTWAVLSAGTGEIGRLLLARNHKIRVGEGMVGWTIAHAISRVAMEVEKDSVRIAVPELSKTRSEAALPLRSRGRILGAISVQSDQVETFHEQVVAVLQSLADQVAVALDNAQLFAESQRSIAHLQQTSQQLTQSAWINFLRSQPVIGYYADDHGLRPILQSSTGVILEDIKVTDNQEEQDPSVLTLSIKVRGEELGTIRARMPVESTGWNEQDRALIQAITDQLGVALENARLYSTTQHSAERERILGEISSRIRASTNVNVILQTAIQQLTEALRVPKGSILLRTVDGEKHEE